MAVPTCPKCDSRTFETQVFEPRGSRFKLMSVNCTSCGAVVGVTDFWNIGQTLMDLGKRLGFDLSR